MDSMGLNRVASILAPFLKSIEFFFWSINKYCHWPNSHADKTFFQKIRELLIIILAVLPIGSTEVE